MLWNTKCCRTSKDASNWSILQWCFLALNHNMNIMSGLWSEIHTEYITSLLITISATKSQYPATDCKFIIHFIIPQQTLLVQKEAKIDQTCVSKTTPRKNSTAPPARLVRPRGSKSRAISSSPRPAASLARRLRPVVETSRARRFLHSTSHAGVLRGQRQHLCWTCAFAFPLLWPTTRSVAFDGQAGLPEEADTDT